MLCPRCMQREANVFFTKNINGKKEEYRVCDVCAKELGLMQSGFIVTMDDFIGQFLGKGLSGDRQESFACPRCHTTFEEFSKTSKFGCGQCYETFEKYLPPIMKRIHGNTEHAGKLPSREKESTIRQKKIVQLKSELCRAVEQEDFEQAARLRDEIRELAKDTDQE